MARLPASFGMWNTVFKRDRDWVKADVFARLFEACSDEPDMVLNVASADVSITRRGASFGHDILWRLPVRKVDPDKVSRLKQAGSLNSVGGDAPPYLADKLIGELRRPR
jgi:hypothetical protein